jgi:spore germination protein YaaH
MKLVDNNGYDGIEIDYEGLWSASDRAPFTAFMRELATAIHGRGKELAMAIPGIPVDSGNNAYDYTALVGFVDTIHVMGYDFHWTNGDHMGPIAPLGWIDGVFARAKATGHPERFILGVPNYAIGTSFFSSSTKAAMAMCSGPIQTTTDHMSSCSYDRFAAGRAVHCTTRSNGTIWFDDLIAIEEKIAAAKRQGGRGVTYWTVGDELPGYFDLVRKYYP